MIEHVRNVIKRDWKRKTKWAVQEPDNHHDTESQWKGVDLLQKCPVNTSGSSCVAKDAGSLEEHKKVIATELRKAKPRDSFLLPLMKSMYGEWRMFILNEAALVAVILTNYLALSRPAIVSLFTKFSNH